MAKDPAFLFYPNDWIGGTMGMSFEDKGVYMELLMMQFNRGHMTDQMIAHAVGERWLNVCHKFAQDENGLWYNERLDIEKERRKNYVSSRNNNKKGKNQHPQKGCLNGHMTCHMENANEYENVNEIKKGGTGENNMPAPVFGIGLTDIDLLKEKVLLDVEFKRVFVQRGLPSGKIEPWLKNFNAFLRYGGVQRKTEKDYRFHFGNWLKDQDLENVDNYSPTPALNNNSIQNHRRKFERIPAGAVSGTGGY